MTFLKVVLFILLFYYLLRILGRWFAPKLFQYAVKKTEQRFRDQYQAYQEDPGGEGSIGEVSISKKPGTKRKQEDSLGEYVDYEEIE
ncbi:MAG: DUF4834 domain-containing protein [Eudoraea sp.]|nr:DUF4834 domain-containing protein [Eudoraea sp.]MBT8211408.1 DUF4834 domain-containing protein [Eudoraea sp.]MBT8221700.1 DUF4834 domain-containing protein [Eudoraea sp.]NNK30179.1 DUF4834 domain-containing protein [Flavobacteriaceae bacterium]